MKTSRDERHPTLIRLRTLAQLAARRGKRSADLPYRVILDRQARRAGYGSFEEAKRKVGVGLERAREARL